jgi:predicted nuclease of predicted toxin-antitoxin system
LKFWIDENIETAILIALRAACPDQEFIRVQDTEFSGADDVTLLAEAAPRGVVIITHDKQTLVDFAYDRIRAGLAMPGVIALKVIPVGVAVRHLSFLIGTSSPADFDHLVWYIPLAFDP